MKWAVTLMTEWAYSIFGIPDKSHLTSNREAIGNLAVALIRYARGWPTHSGIVYKNANDELRFLHFTDPGPASISDERCDSSKYIFALPFFSLPEHALIFAEFCGRVYRANLNKRIPYRFEYDPNVKIDERTGSISITDQQTGYTCSTFVVALFKAVNQPLVITESWPLSANQEDRRERTVVLNAWSQSSHPGPREAAQRNWPLIKVKRVSPTQVAAACLHKPPVGYRRASRASGAVKKRLDQEFAFLEES